MSKQLTLPELGKHAVFLGMTGSGKSELASQMINHYKGVRIFSIDTDDSVEIKGSKTVRSPAEAKFWFYFYDKLRYVWQRRTPKQRHMRHGHALCHSYARLLRVAVE